MKLLDFGLSHLMAASAGSLRTCPRRGRRPTWRRSSGGARRRTRAPTSGRRASCSTRCSPASCPIPGATLEELRARVLSPEPVPPVRERHPELPGEVEPLVATALAKEPGPAAAHGARSCGDELRGLEERLRAPARGAAAPVAPAAPAGDAGVLPARGVSPDSRDGWTPRTSASWRRPSSGAVRRSSSGTAAPSPCPWATRCSPASATPVAGRRTRSGRCARGCCWPGACRRRSSGSCRTCPCSRCGGHHASGGACTRPRSWAWSTPTLQGEAPRVAVLAGAPGRARRGARQRDAWKLVRGAFETEPLGAVLHGLPGWRAWRSTGWCASGRAVSRFERTLVAGGLTPLVGRERELRQLLALWERARRGAGRLRAAPRRGRHRQVPPHPGAARAGAAGDGHALAAASAGPSSAPAPSIPSSSCCGASSGSPRRARPQRNLRRAGGAAGSAGPARGAHAAARPAARRCPCPRAPLHRLTPERQKEKTLEALADAAPARGEERPVLARHGGSALGGPLHAGAARLLLEHVEGARAARRPQRPPRVPARPGPRAPGSTGSCWSGCRPSSRPSPGAGGGPGHELPEETVQQLVARTDGIPLFVEEMTRMVLEGGAAGVHPRHPARAAAGAAGHAALPAEGAGAAVRGGGAQTSPRAARHAHGARGHSCGGTWRGWWRRGCCEEREEAGRARLPVPPRPHPGGGLPVAAARHAAAAPPAHRPGPGGALPRGGGGAGPRCSRTTTRRRGSPSRPSATGAGPGSAPASARPTRRR